MENIFEYKVIKKKSILLSNLKALSGGEEMEGGAQQCDSPPSISHHIQLSLPFLWRPPRIFHSFKLYHWLVRELYVMCTRDKVPQT